MLEHINRLIQNALVNNSKHITMVRMTMPRVDEFFILNVFHEDLGSDEEPASITSGKDFALVRTVSGKASSSSWPFAGYASTALVSILFCLDGAGVVYWKVSKPWYQAEWFSGRQVDGAAHHKGT